MKTYYVYILECSDKSYYKGFSSKLYSRIIEHQTGKYPDCYTYTRLPVKLVFHAEFTDPNYAIDSEKQKKMVKSKERSSNK